MPRMTRLVRLSAVFMVAFFASLPAHAVPRAPVILVVFDEFPVDSLRTPDGRIDAARYPGFGRLARAATWFPNAFSVQDQTSHALPAILDGRHPRRGARPVYSDHPDNLFTFLAGRGYRVTASEPFSSLCPPSICPESILGGPGPPPFFLSKRAARFRNMLQAIRPMRRPLLIFQHQILPHQPWEFLPSGRRYRGDPDPWERGLSSPLGFHDAFLTHQNQQRFLLQVGFVDRELGMLLDRLERTNLFERALIVVTADHGIGFDIGVSDRRAISQANLAEVAPVPFFVKAPRQRQSRVQRSYVHTIDVLPTIADVLGLKLTQQVDGRSAFARRGAHTVRLPTFDISSWVAASPAQLERARTANRLHQARLFGVGRRSVFRLGPRGDILGKGVDAFRPETSAMRVSGLKADRTFGPESGHAPIWFTGRVLGGQPGSTHQLALAINESIAAVGRSFYLRDSPSERFSLLIPEDALRPGPNHAALYEIRRLALGRLNQATPP
jgi:hypothetical protein